MKKKRTIQNIIGYVSLTLLILIIVFSVLGKKMQKKNTSTSAAADGASTVSFVMQTQELTYDGEGELDLLQGVKLLDTEGKRTLQDVTTCILSEGTLGRKTIRYAVQDSTGKEVSCKRTLVLQNYAGPSIEVQEHERVDAKNLPNLVSYLQQKGALKAQNGYGDDITSTVKCMREKVKGNVYMMTFQVTNAFGDTAQKRVEMVLTGRVKDPLVTLTEKEIEIPKGGSCMPENFVLRAFDGEKENLDLLKIENRVQADIPGSYTIFYKMYNPNKTAVHVAKLTVHVTE